MLTVCVVDDQPPHRDRVRAMQQAGTTTQQQESWEHAKDFLHPIFCQIFCCKQWQPCPKLAKAKRIEHPSGTVEFQLGKFCTAHEEFTKGGRLLECL